VGRFDAGDREGFIRGVLKLRVPRPFLPIEDANPLYTKVIDDLGLRGECDEIVRFIMGLQ
jgi:hypothetical protein